MSPSGTHVDVDALIKLLGWATPRSPARRITSTEELAQFAQVTGLPSRDALKLLRKFRGDKAGALRAFVEGRSSRRVSSPSQVAGDAEDDDSTCSLPTTASPHGAAAGGHSISAHRCASTSTSSAEEVSSSEETASEAASLSRKSPKRVRILDPPPSAFSHREARRPSDGPSRSPDDAGRRGSSSPRSPTRRGANSPSPRLSKKKARHAALLNIRPSSPLHRKLL